MVEEKKEICDRSYRELMGEMPSLSEKDCARKAFRESI